MPIETQQVLNVTKRQYHSVL